jgi:oxygen-independent coproporphyrinogen-3 oxidase
MLLGGTRYGAGLTPSDDAVADFYAEACSVLDAEGLRQYEISNFARAGCESRHNLRYWQRRPYLGVGLAAHSMLRSLRPESQPKQRTLAAEPAVALWPAPAFWPGDAVRFSSGDDFGVYQRAVEPWQPHRLSPTEEFEEAWFLGLRCNAGVSLAAIRTEFGLAALELAEPVLAQLAEDGLIYRTERGDRVALTDRGRMLSNEVFANFLDLEQTQSDRAESTAFAAPAR